jgi:hypothetical protein
MLTKQGYHSTGNQILYNGQTGEQLETEIYFGPTYYLRLKHMPKDKINYRARGPRTALTRQTVQGRANDGGLRIGEMDRDCLIAHGLSGFIKESMMVRGDEYYMAICNKTGCIAIYNEANNIFLSPMADGPVKFVGNLLEDLNIINVSKYGRDFSIVGVPYAFKLLMQELQAMNVQMRIITEDNVDQLLSLTKGKDIIKLTADKFQNLEQIQNEIKSIQFKDKSPPVIKEKTPEQEVITIPETWRHDYLDPFATGEMHLDTQNFGYEVIGTQLDQSINLGDPKSQYRFNDGDVVVFKDDKIKNKYKILEFDGEEMKYITEGIDGPDKGVIRNSWSDDLMTPESSPDYVPTSPDYAPESPDYVPTSPDYAPESPTWGPDENQPGTTPPSEEDDSPKVVYERELGSADEGKEKEAETILKTVSSLNEQKTEGLDKLLPSKEEDKEDKKDDDTKTKKIE